MENSARNHTVFVISSLMKPVAAIYGHAKYVIQIMPYRQVIWLSPYSFFAPVNYSPPSTLPTPTTTTSHPMNPQTTGVRGSSTCTHYVTHT